MLSRMFCWSILVVFFSCQSENERLNQFAPLIGEWIRVGDLGDETVSKEVWRLEDDGSFEGVGLTIEDGDTIFVEKLKIYQKGKIIYYQAEVAHNPNPVDFEWQGNSPNWRFENLDHDFPKVIQYFMMGDSLKVVISGNGKEIPFVFKRLKNANS